MTEHLGQAFVTEPERDNAEARGRMAAEQSWVQAPLTSWRADSSPLRCFLLDRRCTRRIHAWRCRCGITVIAMLGRTIVTDRVAYPSAAN